VKRKINKEKKKENGEIEKNNKEDQIERKFEFTI